MIRPGRPADEPRLRALQSHLSEPSPDLLTYGLGAGDVLVSAADTGRPVGYVLAVGHGDAGTPSSRVTAAEDAVPAPDDATRTGHTHPDRSRPETGDVHVAELVVAPPSRREGRARALLSAVIADADGRVTLAVAPDNEGARALYRSLGFECVGRDEARFEAGPALFLAR